jgi:phosphoglycerol transferase MdoB-like AlkP superfamily enzyme
MYHEALTYKAIASGYKDKRNQDLQAAQYFDNEYEIAVKKAKKRARSNNVTVGYIVPHSY